MLAGIIPRSAAAAPAYKSLHDFGPYPEGARPINGLTLGRDGNYYCATENGGKFGLGSIIRMTPAGVSTLMYSFSYSSGFSRPDTGLALGSDGALYGSTMDNGGKLYRYDPQTNAVTVAFTNTSFALLSTFLAGKDGALYGTARFGGASLMGLVLRYQPGGSIKVIHSFTAAEGSILLMSEPITMGTDGYIYGATQSGGANGIGIVFKMNLGGALIKLYDLSSDDGNQMLGAPTVGRDNTVICSTYSGGQSGLGSIFKIGTNGKGHTTLHNFAPGEPDYVFARLYQASDNRYYGGGGAVGGGVIFSIGADGSYRTVHTLSPQEGIGIDSPLMPGAGGLLYSTTVSGGTYGAGSIYRVSTTGQFTTLKSFKSVDGAGTSGAPVVGPDGNFYGVTLQGGAYNHGSIYRTTPAGVTTIIHSFDLMGSANPTPLTIGPDGAMYGATRLNSVTNTSQLYRIDINGVFKPIHMFTGEQSGQITLGRDHRLYGATGNYVYVMNTSGVISTVAISKGYGFGQLVQGGDGNLYSALQGGGLYKHGGLYKITLHGVISDVHDFQANVDGILVGDSPLVVGRDGNIYGSATWSVFRYKVATGAYNILRQFASSSQFVYNNVAIKDDGTIFGIVKNPGDSNTLFNIDTRGSYAEQTLFPSWNSNAQSPSLAFAPDGTLYGAWTDAGTHNSGVVFKFVGL